MVAAKSQRRTVVLPYSPNGGVRPTELRKRLFDIALACTLVILIAPLLVVIAIAVKLESRGPILYRSRRAGRRGAEFEMLKFRKMHDGAVGAALTSADDPRFTRIGRVLARTKLDEIPQLFNVLKGEMSIVGPRPEDPGFVKLEPQRFACVGEVRPGMTGLSQLAFARESEILDPLNPMGHYVGAILPQKLALDTLYATRRTTRMDLAIIAWTVFAILGGWDVAVNRMTGKLTRRHRKPLPDIAVESSQAA
jgi:lipopolysaccharide/colanic/teichoic acid biosynthesis glycosyltransferase